MCVCVCVCVRTCAWVSRAKKGEGGGVNNHRFFSPLLSVLKHAHTHTHVHTHGHTCTHTHAHTCTHTHAHTLKAFFFRCLVLQCISPSSLVALLLTIAPYASRSLPLFLSSPPSRSLSFRTALEKNSIDQAVRVLLSLGLPALSKTDNPCQTLSKAKQKLSTNCKMIP